MAHDQLLRFTPVHTTRSLDGIVRQVQEAILAGRLAQGDRLASERELVAAFGVSRATIREALRILEALGWVEIRLGAQGGVFIVRPTADTAGSALAALLRFHEASPKDLEEFRVSFEPETARWAARRSSPSQVQALTRIVDRIHLVAEDPAVEWRVVSALDLDFHLGVAEASRNRVRVAVMLAVRRSVQAASIALEPLMEVAVRRSIAQELERVAQAIAAGDEDGAASSMRDHVTRFARLEAEILVPAKEPFDDC
jgi:GntR family transcriptional regulator, transcriptional repressor for pyruvate dehydrogenase complex